MRQGKRFEKILIILVSVSVIGSVCRFAYCADGVVATAAIHETRSKSDWIDHDHDGIKSPFEDPSESIEVRVEDLLNRMTLDEKTCQLATLYGYKRVLVDDLPTSKWKTEIWKDGIANIDEHINGIAEWEGKPASQHLGPPSKHAEAIDTVQRWFVEETRLGIPVDFTNEGIRGLCYYKATNFPSQLGIGATWDRKLVREVGRITGLEGRALGYTNIYSPILDLARDPRWGRVVECYGEDPFHVASLGLEQVHGLRSAGVGSTLKHFAVYSVPQGGRDGDARTDPQVTPREVESIFLYPFREVIRNSDVVGVMSSYNDYNGVPVSGSREMLCAKLRDEWGFRGYVVSDSDAVSFLSEKHRVAKSRDDTVRLFLDSGGNVRTEFNSPANFILPARRLVQEGRLAEDIVDARVRDVLATKYRLGLFDEPYVSHRYDADEIIHCKEHREIALRAARESIVLLKNADQTLPLSKSLKKILVCGPNANAIEHSQNRYGPVAGNVISVIEGIRTAVSPDTQILFAEGATLTDDNWPESELLREPPGEHDAAMISHAVEMANKVDVIVAVLGDGEATVGESRSRTDLNLAGYQEELVRALHATGKPVVAILLNGRPATINWIDRHVPAVVEAWFPGEFCGKAVADVLFGDYNPGGKLPVTFPKTVGQIPWCFPFKRGSHGGQTAVPWKTHADGSLYPFGHGLSYTTFDYSDLVISESSVSPGDSLTVTCRVTNSGNRTGDEVVQLYLRDEYASVVPYDSTLRGFERISLEAGETRAISFEIRGKDMEILGADGDWVVEPGDFEVMIGSSSEDIRMRGQFTVFPSNLKSLTEREKH